MNAMDRFTICFRQSSTLLMEGALGERLKREEHILFDPHVAMAGLIYEERPREALRRLWNEYIGIAEKYGFPCMVTTPTRRANRERVAHSLFTDTIIQDNVRFLQDFRAAAKKIPLFIGGLMGCRGDAYTATDVLSVREAEAFHCWQAEAFGRAGADFLFAGIMPVLSEAVLRLNDVIRLKIVGGCCGTDGKHMEEIAKRLSLLRFSEVKEHGRQG